MTAAAAGAIEADRPRVVYISYDGMGEPLGRSQVVAYLTRLASAADITLISFEKDQQSRRETAALLRSAGIEWVPYSYHRRPPVFSTLWDVMVGARAVRRAVRRRRAEIVHARSYVPALMALIALIGQRKGASTRFLFDIRGFWPDERVLGGRMSDRSPVYRVAKRLERVFFGRADAVVTLTAASLPHIRRWLSSASTPVRVIPTCADVKRFGAPAQHGTREQCVVWAGSVGSFYRFELAVRFADAMELPLKVLTPNVSAARALLNGREADVRTVPHEAVASELHPGDIGVCFYADGFANLARAPTRFAEYLAAGLVVAVTPRIGDLDEIIEEHGLGVIIDDESSEGLRIAGRRALERAADPDVRARGRRVAGERYSIENGVRDYLELYRRLRVESTTWSAAEPLLTE